MKDLIKFSVKSARVDNDGRIKRVSIRKNMESTREQLATNEMPLIMASFRNIAIDEANNQFTYTFPFPLS